MAHMYPAELRPDTKSNAERELYRALADALPDDYTVFHSVRWLARDPRSGARDGEADFVLVHPKRGILLIEAKGGHIRYDGVADRWHSNAYEIKDPLVQAERNKHSLREKLRATPALQDRWINIGHAVAFPDIIVDGALRLDAPREVVLDHGDMADIKEWVEKALAFYVDSDERSPGLGDAGVRTVIDVLSPSLEIRSPLSTAIAAEAQAIIRLTQEQFEVLTLLTYQRRAAVCGCAGSGKTTLAMEQARRLAVQGFRVLLTCFNAPLAGHLRHQRPRDAAYTVLHFHQLCQKMAEQAELHVPPPRTRDDEHYYERVLPEALLDASSKLGPQYDAIIVDEGQDFRPDWWVALQAMLADPGHGIFYVFYDDNQNLYQTEQSLPPDLPRYPLRRNCRNTQAIHRAFLPFYRSPVEPEAAGPAGRAPQVTLYRSDLRLRQMLSQVLHQLIINERVLTKDIVILTPRSPDRSELTRWGSAGNYRLTAQRPTNPGEVFFTSIYQFKGLEAPVIILAEFRPAKVQDADTLLYVGCSRACNHLVILADESLPEEVRARLPKG